VRGAASASPVAVMTLIGRGAVRCFPRDRRRNGHWSPMVEQSTWLAPRLDPIKDRSNLGPPIDRWTVRGQAASTGQRAPTAGEC
jgi:hypothetical protein